MVELEVNARKIMSNKNTNRDTMIVEGQLVEEVKKVYLGQRIPIRKENQELEVTRRHEDV